MQLLAPSLCLLDSYTAALRRGWMPNSMLGTALAQQELQQIEHDPAHFIACQNDELIKGNLIHLPDGNLVERLPGYRRWLWDGEFCGYISFRARPGSAALPEHYLGHIGYNVVPWKQRRGYASRALALLLAEIRQLDLDYVELTSDAGNLASQKIILAAGGELSGRFQKPPHLGGNEALRYIIRLR